MERKTFKITGIIFVAFIVSCILLSSILISEAWGRFFTQADGGDGGRVARFDVGTALQEGGESKESFSITLAPEQSSTYTVQVTNDSEVAVLCTIEAINQTNNLPLIFTLERSDGTTTENTPLTEEYAAGTSGTYTYTLTVAWDETRGEFTYQGMVDHVIVSVRCEQMD